MEFYWKLLKLLYCSPLFLTLQLIMHQTSLHYINLQYVLCKPIEFSLICSILLLQLL